MSTELLTQLTGSPSWESFFEEYDDTLLVKLLEESKGCLDRCEYPTDITPLKSFHGGIKNCLVKEDYTRELKSEYSCLTSYLSLPERVKAYNYGKQSPINFLKENGESVLYTIWYRISEFIGKEAAFADLKANIHKYILETIHEKKLLVNTFPYWRVWSLMNNRIQKAIAHIRTGGDLEKLIELCGCYDPTAGWGCRLTSFLLIKAKLLEEVKASGHYSDAQIDEFRHAEFYIGCDTNVALQGMYAKLTAMVCEQYDLGLESAKVHCKDCIGDGIEVMNYAKSLGISVLMTSPPTPLEQYSNCEGDSMTYAGNYMDDQNQWVRTFLSEFLYKVVAAFSDGFVAIHIDGFTININGIRRKCDVGEFFFEVLRSNREVFGKVMEVGCCYMDPIKNTRCPCNRKKCGKCGSCMKYGFCSVVDCDQPVKCDSYMIRSCYVIGQ
jgi:hypothetical protein